MTVRATVVAALAVVLALAVLGVQWEGRQAADGQWIDGVSLRQWAAFWTGLAALGGVTARLVPNTRLRLIAALPMLVLLAYLIGGSALGPIPVVVYLVPTVLVWVGSVAAGDLLQRVLARSMKH